ncbi:hypothetical protein HELRODRAFT_189225 [Helobdella robusta]|uniref:U3 small nucleolar RNA-associated protein 14 homolog A n=1 Tax=Helobdella robusta TaxID=6412 RepID=T1FQT8_HELRO|nr:hypothetical protein HELRODRAFT_189225 [Helobdella robusta]ESN96389.1 hypothetical protein HELRODRAFT_189225 [Helobdella robusta]
MSNKADDDFELWNNEKICEDENENEDELKLQHLKKTVAQLSGKQRRADLRTEPTTNISTLTSLNKVSLDDLISPETKQSKDLLALKKDLKKQNVLEKPLHRAEHEKIRRIIGYEEAVKTMTCWDPIIKGYDKQKHMNYPLVQPNINIIEKTNTFVKHQKPLTNLELAVADVLQANKDHLIDTKPLSAFEERALKAMSIEKAQARRAELQKQRALLSYHAAKMKRQGKIKSKRYHRLLRKSKRKEDEKKLEEMKVKDPEAYQQWLAKEERKRIEERMTLKHKGASKLMKRQTKYGKQAVQDMIQTGKELAAKKELDSDDDDDDEEEDADEEEEMGEKEDGAAKDAHSKQGVIINDDDDDKGEESNEDDDVAAADDDDDGKVGDTEDDAKKDDDDNADKDSGESEDDDEDDDDDNENDDEDEEEENGAEKSKLIDDDNDKDDVDVSVALNENTVRKRTYEEVDKSDDEEGDVREDNDKDDDGDDLENPKHKVDGIDDEDKTKEWKESHGKKSKKRKLETGSIVRPQQFIQVKERVVKKPAIDGSTSSGQSKTKTVSEAMEEDEVMMEFVEEKKQMEERDKLKDIDMTLPGWGEWTGVGIKVSKKKRKRFIIKAPLQPPRKDKHLNAVIISELKDEAIAKHQVSTLPWQYHNVHEFQRSIKQPIGKQWNREEVYKKKITPRNFIKMGQIIEPIDKNDVFKKLDKSTFNSLKSSNDKNKNNFKSNKLRSKNAPKKHKGPK